MKIETSLDFAHIRTQLVNELSTIKYNPDLNKILGNIDGMIKELSKAEVIARRRGKIDITREEVDRINHAIDHLLKLIVMAKLMN